MTFAYSQMINAENPRTPRVFHIKVLFELGLSDFRISFYQITE